jgi:Zn finger protein HypA/HybF involved in hydrogenase expression
MSQTRTTKASRSIPEHIKRAVNARDHYRCQNCGVVTEFIHYDHIFPFDLGGPTTVENIQSLCPKCNTSKGNKIQCHKCRHWMSPDNAKCPQCGARFRYSKRSKTLAGKLEILFERVGRAVVIGGLGLILILFIVGGFYVVQRFRNSDSASDQSASANTIVNDSFNVSPGQPATFKFVIPSGAKNARAVGGFKVTSGSKINFYVLSEEQMAQWSNGAAGVPSLTKREQTSSARVRQALQPGTYFLLFSSVDAGGSTTVAAEFYAKYD